MRLLQVCALAALALLPQVGSAQTTREAAKPGPGEWVTNVSVHRIDENPTDPPAGHYTGVGTSWDQAWQSWVTEADMPGEYRRRAFKSVSRVAVDVDTAGRPAGCRALSAGAEPRLDTLACELLMKRAKFDVRYAGPGQPMPYRFAASIPWQTIKAAEMGPPPPPMFISPAPDPGTPPPPPEPGSIRSGAAWPRLNWTDDLILGPGPAIQAGWPGEQEGTVSLDLTLSPQKGPTDCRIGISSGSADLDEAACRVARTVPVRYKKPCEFCWDRTIPLQIVWKKQGSHVRLPLEPSSSAYVGDRRQVAGTLSAADFASIPDRSVKKREATPLLRIDRDGKPTKCSLHYSTGNRAVDARLCALIMERMRYSRRTDVFGEPAADLYFARIPLDGLL